MQPSKTSSAFTPGPWVLIQDGHIRQQAIIGKWDNDICQMPFSTLNEAKEMGPEQLGNARLIAAAPAMHDKLEAVRDYLESFFDSYQKLDAITTFAVAQSCPIRRLENCITEIDQLLAEAHGKAA